MTQIINKQALIDAAEKFGFNLEFKTSRELERNEFSCELNRVFHLENRPIEIDLIARSRKRPDFHLIIECKGANTDTILLLVKASKNRFENDNDDMASSSRYFIENKKYMPIFKIDSGSVVYTTTGDFVIYSKNEYKKSSKNDDQNNFYKAQKQILESIKAYSHHLRRPGEKDFQFITPIIVTNAQIWTIDYNGDKPEVSQQKGALHRVIDDCNRFSIDVRSDPKRSTNSVVVPVINYQYLDAMLEKVNVLRGNVDSQINLDLRLES